ncbi:MAG: hypothetical protein ACKOX1_01505 [Ignavibacteria bacterium]|jgi:hypothetical protein
MMIKIIQVFFKSIIPTLSVGILMCQTTNAQVNNLSTVEGLKKHLSSAKWDVIKSNHGLDFLDRAWLNYIYTYTSDKITVYKGDGSILDESKFYLSQIKEISNGIVTFKVSIELTKSEQEFNGRKQDIYTYKIIDMDTIEICDNQNGPPCESNFIIKRVN